MSLMEEIYLEPHHHFLIRTKYLLSLNETPLFLDGALEIKNLRILRYGAYKEIQREVVGAKLIDLEDHILMPVLTNAHLHLELSALRFRIPPTGKFILWVRQVIKKRMELSPLEIKESATIAIKELLKEGVGIIGDVGNSALTLEPLSQSPLLGYLFQEIINFKGKKISLSPLKEFSNRLRLTYSAHAPYTVSPLLLQAIKAYCRKRKKLFVIHLAESKEEIQFLREGTGPIAELLKERNQWNEAFIPIGTTPVKYLDSLGVLDENTLAIHAIHLEEEDLKILSQRGVKICLCPRSNLYTGAGFPNLPQLLKYKLSLCLGTDSLASNDRLSIFEEMKTLLHFYPDTDPLLLLRIGSIYGAKILGFEDYGTIKEGAFANLVAISLSYPPSENPKEFARDFLFSEKEVKYRFYALN